MASSDTESMDAYNELQKQQLSNEEEQPNMISESKTNEKGHKKSMTKMMKQTMTELEATLRESQALLGERDKEIERLTRALEQSKQKLAKEVAAKTELAQALDDTHQQAVELESSLKKRQLSLREYQQRVEHLEITLQQEKNKSIEQERRFGEIYSAKCKDIEQLTHQLSEIRKKKDKPASAGAQIDESQLIFLKQAVFNLLTDSHAEDHLRAIVSILNFNPQERKAVYSKVQEKKGRASYGASRSTTPIVLTQ